MNIVKTIILILMAGFVGFIIYRAILSNRGGEVAVTHPEFRDIEKNSHYSWGNSAIERDRNKVDDLGSIG